MYQTLCRVYRDPDGPSKENYSTEPYKAVMREHEGEEFITYHYNLKGQQANILKSRKLTFKEAENCTLCYHKSVPYSSLYLYDPSYTHRFPKSSYSVTPPLLVLDPHIQRGRKLYLKRLQQEYQYCCWLFVQGTIREKSS